LKDVAKEYMRKDPLHFLQDGRAEFCARAALRAHPGGRVDEDDFRDLLVELHPKAIEYALDLATRYGMMRQVRGETLELSEEFKTELETVLIQRVADEEERTHKEFELTRTLFVQTLSELSEYATLAAEGDAGDSALVTMAVFDALRALGVVQNFK
jgi:hypothetical protein